MANVLLSVSVETKLRGNRIKHRGRVAIDGNFHYHGKWRLSSTEAGLEAERELTRLAMIEYRKGNNPKIAGYNDP